MKFWDASAVVPLLLDEPGRGPLIALVERDPVLVTWWGTVIECTSAIARREREAAMSLSQATRCLERLRLLSTAWQEVGPVDAVRTIAQRLLRTHPLRAADSLQLAAAVVAAERDPSSLEFVCLDERLGEAAEREGFRVVAG